jgi:hypothetical protein
VLVAGAPTLTTARLDPFWFTEPFQGLVREPRGRALGALGLRVVPPDRELRLRRPIAASVLSPLPAAGRAVEPARLGTRGRDRGLVRVLDRRAVPAPSPRLARLRAPGRTGHRRDRGVVSERDRALGGLLRGALPAALGRLDIRGPAGTLAPRRCARGARRRHPQRRDPADRSARDSVPVRAARGPRLGPDLGVATPLPAGPRRAVDRPGSGRPAGVRGIPRVRGGDVLAGSSPRPNGSGSPSRSGGSRWACGAE